MATSAYAVRARQHWQEHLPRRYQALTDPEAFFDDVGTQIAQQVALREQDLMNGFTPGPDYLANLKAVNTAHLQAEGEVLREMLPPPDEDSPAI
jgi:hypothetical protein